MIFSISEQDMIVAPKASKDNGKARERLVEYNSVRELIFGEGWVEESDCADPKSEASSNLKEIEEAPADELALLVGHLKLL